MDVLLFLRDFLSAGNILKLIFDNKKSDRFIEDRNQSLKYKWTNKEYEKKHHFSNIDKLSAKSIYKAIQTRNTVAHFIATPRKPVRRIRQK